MTIKLIEKNGEKIAAFTLYGNNRDQEILSLHQKVMVDKFGFDINYVWCPFPAVSNGYCINKIIAETIDAVKPDYYWFIDNDLVILNKKAVDIMYDLVKHKRGIVSHVQNSNHKKNRLTESKLHAYAGPGCLLFPSKLYNTVGRPCMDHWSDGSDEYGGDTAERLTFEVKKAGGIVSLIYPSSVVLKNSNLDNGEQFGMGNTFSDICFHAMQANNPQSKVEFIKICEQILKV